jgi:hypothetical protein
MIIMEYAPAFDASLEVQEPWLSLIVLLKSWCRRAVRTEHHISYGFLNIGFVM